MLKDWILAFMEVKRQVKEKRKREAAYKVLVGSELNYVILKDLINTARYDVVIHVVLKDGTKLDIERKKYEGVLPPPRSEYY